MKTEQKLSWRTSLGQNKEATAGVVTNQRNGKGPEDPFMGRLLLALPRRNPTPQYGPTWRCNECGHTGKDFRTIEHPAGDFDLECPKCEATDVQEKK